MLRPRVIPVVTLDGEQMVKTMGFDDPIYLGDPFNAVRIFNTKEVDELVILDITASSQRRVPNLGFVTDLAGECFMPLAYGGGVDSADAAGAILGVGVEKIVVNSGLLARPQLANDLVAAFGSQSVVASVDVKHRRLRGPRVVSGASYGVDFTDREPLAWVRDLEARGVGEVFLTSADRDGSAKGYDLDLIRACASSIGIPIVACGGAGTTADLAAALAAGAAAAAAGRMFVTHGRHRAALVSYPDPALVEGLGG